MPVNNSLTDDQATSLAAAANTQGGSWTTATIRALTLTSDQLLLLQELAAYAKANS